MERISKALQRQLGVEKLLEGQLAALRGARLGWFAIRLQSITVMFIWRIGSISTLK
jgi:hypothetical protein